MSKGITSSYFVVAGGKRDDIEVFDPSEAKWTVIGPRFPSSWDHMQQSAVSVNKDMIIIGGYGGQGNEIFTLSVDDGTFALTQWETTLSQGRYDAVAIPLPVTWKIDCQ